MTNKLFSKTLKKTTLLSVLITVILAAAIVVGALFGLNRSAIMDDSATLTVAVNGNHKNHKEDMIETCEAVFEEAGISAKYVIKGDISPANCELVFVFDKDVDTEAVKGDVKTALGEYAGFIINVSAAKEAASVMVAKHFELRAGIAMAIFAVLAFAYVAIRYKSVWTGAAVGIGVAVAMLLAAGVIILTRIPVTVSVGSAIVVAGLLTAVSAVMTVSKAKGEGAEGDKAEKVLSALPVKESVLLGGGLAFAMLLVGILGKTTAAWYAVAAFVSIAVALLVSLFFLPAVYLSLQKVEEKQVAKKASYVGAKKSSKKDKKAEEAAVEATEETEA